MILEQKQCRRFYRLFDCVIIYVAKRLDVTGTLLDGAGRMKEREVYRVAERVWGKDGDRSLVQDFVSENPWKLNRSDLREVESWKDALCARFPVVRIGRDVLFLYGNHAFAVRGLSQEIDDVTGPLPVFAQTIIMPFDGLITYCTAITSYSIDIGPNMRLSLTEEAAECCATGKLVRTARDYARELPLAHQEELEHEASEFAHKTELEMNADELGKGQHVGVLVGLDWEERDKAVEAHMRESMPITHDILERQFDEWCDAGKPAQTLADAFAYLTRKDLIAYAKYYGVRRGLSKLNKAQIIDEIVYTIKDDGPLFVEQARLNGTNSVKALQRVCFAGGCVSYSDKNLSRLDDVPMPVFPEMLLYHDRSKGVYNLVAPREVCEALEECNWEMEIAATEATERAIRSMELLVDYRGVVPFEDAMGELPSEIADDVNPLAMFVTMQERCVRQTVDFDTCEINNEVYFLHPSVAMEAGIRKDGLLDDPDYVLDILAEQSGKPPRHLDDIKDGLGVEPWMFTRKSAQNLAVYLDSHVPDGCDDYFFAEKVVGEIIWQARDFVDIPYLLDWLNEEGFEPTEAQLNRLLELIYVLMNDVPKWVNNGWSATELQERI